MKALVALLLSTTLASAADLTLKAAPTALAAAGCTVTICEGFFVGGSLASAGGNFDIVGSGIDGLASNGFSLGGQTGFEFFKSNLYAALYFHSDFDTSLNAVPGASFANKVTYGGCVRLGYSLAGVFGSVTTSGVTPTLPQALLSSLMTPYVNVCEDRRHNQPAIATGAGVEALIAANAAGQSAWTLNLDYLRFTYNQGGAGGSVAGMPLSQTDDNLIKVSLNYHFGL